MDEGVSRVKMINNLLEPELQRIWKCIDYHQKYTDSYSISSRLDLQLECSWIVMEPACDTFPANYSSKISGNVEIESQQLLRFCLISSLQLINNQAQSYVWLRSLNDPLILRIATQLKLNWNINGWSVTKACRVGMAGVCNVSMTVNHHCQWW